MTKITNQIYKKSLILHKKYRGKVAVIPKCPVRNLSDFNYWYTPGVAAACKEIAQQVEKVYEYTNKWNTVAVISDGSRVLGLGNIGPYAALPVMEGKALIFKFLGGVDAIPIVVSVQDPDEFIKTVKNIAPSFGGINLEDIEQPKCFYILERLRNELDIPVWHDDQQGTATVTLAGLINALRIVNKKLNEIKIVLVGAGAANVCIARLLLKSGANPDNMIVVDSKGILGRDRDDIRKQKDVYKEKWELCITTNKNNIKGGIEEALVGADVVIAASRPGPGVIKKQWVKKMNKDAIVFAEANPVPEILPDEAKQAGARIVATGRSDFPNQINNSLCFPGMFRGVLDVQAKTITDEMCLSAAEAIANFALKRGINENYIVPTMEEWQVYPEIATAVATTAIQQKLARIKLTQQQLYKNAKKIIEQSIKTVKLITKAGLVKFIFLSVAVFLINTSFAKTITETKKEIVRYKYFAESSNFLGPCGKIYSINSMTVTKDKVLIGLHKYDVSLTYGALYNFEVGIKFNLEEQRDISQLDKNIEKISLYVKHRMISSFEGQPIDLTVGIYRSNFFLGIEKLIPEFYSISALCNLFFSFFGPKKFSYSFSISKYTKWTEFILDINPAENLSAFGARVLLTPEVKLDLFIRDLYNLKNVLFYNFVFGISIKV